jgi:hypothetical protein
MPRSKEVESVIVEEYVAMDEPADKVARTPELAEQLMQRVNARISTAERFLDSQQFADHLVNMRRRGSKNNGLPKLRNGHGPGPGSRSKS